MQQNVHLRINLNEKTDMYAFRSVFFAHLNSEMQGEEKRILRSSTEKMRC